MLTITSDKQHSEMWNRMLCLVFQYHHLLPDFTAMGNVIMPLLIVGKTEEAKEIAEKLLIEVEFENRMDHKPS
jgi:ABC-type antimicrobial peptide transport system, ATPase component